MTRLKQLLRGDIPALMDWLENPTSRGIFYCIGIIIAGCAAYGFSIGMWRSATMGTFVAIKMPTLIALTLLLNGLLNGIFGALLGGGLRFKQSLLCLLMTFTVTAAILGSISPITLMMAINMPSADQPNIKSAHATYLLFHTALIGFAGFISCLHLKSFLKAIVPDKRSQNLTFYFWLISNAFIGAQCSWILRPFFGSPGLKEQFLREHPMQGNFYEAVWSAIKNSAGNISDILFAILVTTLLLLAPSVLFFKFVQFLRKHIAKTI